MGNQDIPDSTLLDPELDIDGDEEGQRQRENDDEWEAQDNDIM